MTSPPEFAELVCTTSYSFLRGASLPSDVVEEAISLGLKGIGIADRNSVAGVVRAWVALRDAPDIARDALRKQKEECGEPKELSEEESRACETDLRLVTGARLVFVDGTPDIIAYPATRYGWGRLTRLLTVGNFRAAKGSCILKFEDLLQCLDDLLLIVLPYASGGEEEPHKNVPPSYQFEDKAPETGKSRLTLVSSAPPQDLAETLERLAPLAPGRLWLGVSVGRTGTDARNLEKHARIAQRLGIPLLATNDALYATPEDRPLHDIVTCVRLGTTIQKAGRQLGANAERHIKPAEEMARLFRRHPQAIAETVRFAERITFDLEQLSYEYPHEPVPRGYTPQAWLETLVARKARKRWPHGLPDGLQDLLDNELKIIGRLGYAAYFLTVHDVVRFANRHGILCQGRGSAANSAICYVLAITSVDPVKNGLLFSRFMSEERAEPPDIDVDFEHERREEVMQYVYRRYSRQRAGIVATVIHYRPRSAVREVGKALGMTEDITTRLTGLVWGSFGSGPDKKRLRQAGFDPENPAIARLKSLSEQLITFPRHLSQHVGGFVLTEDALDATVPIHNAAMKERSFIEWDKDDIDALGLMKVDVLSLGMLTCIRKAYAMIAEQGGPRLTLDNVPDEDGAVFDMLCAADTIGVFQVESRAQMSMLPRLRPRKFYDIAIQVAIVRPGPIQGNMVHPYLRRRGLQQRGQIAFDFPKPSPPNDPDELRDVLGKTLGIPLFQEQAMKLAIVAAQFTDSQANELRRAMATFRNVGTIHKFQAKLVDGMIARGYDKEFAERCYKQIEGFGSYGFPESHAIAFARLAWISAWIKYHYPAVFAAALLNSQPMGFYAPAQIIRCAQDHEVGVLTADVNESGWDNAAEENSLRLGLRQIDGFREEWADAIKRCRPFASIEELARRASLPRRALKLLADADALGSLSQGRREGGWEVRRTHGDQLPLFAKMEAPELADEPDAQLPAMGLGEEISADYQTIRLSLKGHPMQILRPVFAAEGIKACAGISASKNGAQAKVAGVVLVRQRPGKGNAIFVTLEDETGITNIIMWARTFDRFRREVMASRLMEVHGEVQRSPEGVIHLMAHRIVDRTAELTRLSDTHTPNPQLSRADEFLHPQQSRYTEPRGSHPRDVRILPRSRDFH